MDHRLQQAIHEIENVKKEQIQANRNMLNNMTAIFGIFVTVFTFVIISGFTALKIVPGNDFFHTAIQVLSIVLPIVFSLIILISFVFFLIWKTER